MASQSDLNKDLDSFEANTKSGLLSYIITTENELGLVLTSTNAKKGISLIYEHTHEIIREEKLYIKKNYFC